MSAPPAARSGLDIAPRLLALKPAAMLHSLTHQPASVWAVLAYLFFEYVRPQSIYTALDILPWGTLSLAIAVALALVSEFGKRRWMILDTGMVLYTVIVLASLVAAYDLSYGLEGLDIYIGWVLAYIALSTTINTPTRVVLMLLSWFIWNLKMTLFAFRSWAAVGFAFRDWGVVGAPGWFGNSGEFGIQMAVIFPISLYFALGVRRHVSTPMFVALLVLPATAVLGAIASSSRGALLAVAVVALWILFRSRYKVRGALLLAAAGAVAFAFVPEQQRQRFSNAGDDGTSVSRLVYWERGIEFANDHPLLGVGYRNWLPYYTSVWGGRLEGRQRIQVSHNFLIECVSELGYTGLLALLFLLFGSFRINAKTRALSRQLGDDGALTHHLADGLDGALIGFMVSGFFVTVLYYPYLWINLGMTAALHLSVTRATRALATRGARSSLHARDLARPS